MNRSELFEGFTMVYELDTYTCVYPFGWINLAKMKAMEYVNKYRVHNIKFYYCNSRYWQIYIKESLFIGQTQTCVHES